MGADDLAAIAARHGFSAEAADVALRALRSGHGRMAQFSHPEFGGLGQWSPGMIMIGAMFDGALKARVDGFFTEVAGHVGSEPCGPRAAGPEAGGDWWPTDLGRPSSTGAQNDMHYALFPDRARLAVERGGTVTIYDTGSHRITSFGQQQGGSQSLSLSGAAGPVSLHDLAVAADEGPSRATLPHAEAAPPADAPATPGPARSLSGDPLDVLERLADLHRRGVITEAEFGAKKAELLARL